MTVEEAIRHFGLTVEDLRAVVYHAKNDVESGAYPTGVERDRDLSVVLQFEALVEAVGEGGLP